jgi:hypothetical protein
MAIWKSIDLSYFEPVPVKDLKSGSIYVMTPTGLYSTSRLKILFNKHFDDNPLSGFININVIDVVSVIANSRNNPYLGKNLIFSTDNSSFYDYKNIYKKKEIVETIVESMHNTPRSLQSLSREAYFKANPNVTYDQLNEMVPLSYKIRTPKSRKRITPRGGKKNRSRKSRRKYNYK